MGCSVEGCDEPVRCKGYCGRHYKRWRKHGDPLVKLAGGHPRRFALGERSGRLVVVGYDRASLSYLCECDCGNSTTVLASNLTRGQTRSCGCLAREATTARATTHGHARHGAQTPTYGSWIAMKRRCEDPTHHKWHLYGGRGVTICERWAAFENFLADMGERPEGTTIDRIDSDGNYEPGNCRWADAPTQNRNRRSRAAA